MLQYYPFFWGDYIQKTASLSQNQHGAYMLFLRHIYGTGETITEKEKYRVAMAFSEEEREAADFILSKFFTLSNGTWDHLKCREVIAKAEASHKSAVDRGAAGGKKKAEKFNRTIAQLENNSSPATSSDSSTNSSTEPSNPNPKTQTQNPERINLKTLSQTLSQVAEPKIPDDLKAELGEMKPIGNLLGFVKQGFEGKGFGQIGDKKLTEDEQKSLIQAANSFINNLSESARRRAEQNSFGWCLTHLAGVYVLGIPDRGTPDKGYNAAFPAWCLKYTKGKRP